MTATKPGITPFLWFDGDVEEAAKFYVSVFKDARIESVHRPAPGKPAQSGTVTLRGLKLHLFNGGPHTKLTPAFSLMVDCETQQEVDELWAKLSAGGAESRCGWLQDRRIVYSYSMHIDEKKISVSLATIEFEPSDKGTKLILTEQGAFLDGYDDAGSRERGTGALLVAVEKSLGGAK